MAAWQHTAPNPSAETTDSVEGSQRLVAAIGEHLAEPPPFGPLRSALNEISDAHHDLSMGLELVRDISNQFCTSLPDGFDGRLQFLCEAMEAAVERGDVAFEQAWELTKEKEAATSRASEANIEAEARIAGAPSQPGDLNFMDRAAFGLALHEEMATADPDEPMVDVIHRAMDRVRDYLAARAKARGGKAAA